MGKVQKAALSYLLILLFWSWGIAIGKYQVFPYQYLEMLFTDIEKYVKGDNAEKTSLAQKIENDLDLKPSRVLTQYKTSSNRNYQALFIPGTKSRREAARLYADTNSMQHGYRLIYATFDFNTNLHGAILLDSESKIVNTWEVNEEAANSRGIDIKPDTNKFPHGIVILPDGSIIFGFDGSNSLQRWDWCSNPMWNLAPGRYSHSISLTEDRNYAWVLNKNNIVKVSTESGQKILEYSVDDIRNANPDTDIFGILQRVHADRFEWHVDPFHTNDVEPLPSSVSKSFPQFTAGDLLVSMRSPNLIFVLDPETLHVKWWRIGDARRQHDPDWQRDGTITVFDNNMHRGFSRIKKIDPETYASQILYSGDEQNFYTWIRGKHQVLPNGNILVSSPQQGRIFEIDKAGNVVFEFVNTYSDPEHEQLLVSEAIWLPENYFENEIFEACE